MNVTAFGHPIDSLRDASLDVRIEHGLEVPALSPNVRQRVDESSPASVAPGAA